MPNLQRTNQSEVAKPTRLDGMWPTGIAVATVLVFIVFLIAGAFVTAAIMAAATLVAGTLLLTLVTGTAWITQLLRRNR